MGRWCLACRGPLLHLSHLVQELGVCTLAATSVWPILWALLLSQRSAQAIVTSPMPVPHAHEAARYISACATWAQRNCALSSPEPGLLCAGTGLASAAKGPSHDSGWLPRSNGLALPWCNSPFLQSTSGWALAEEGPWHVQSQVTAAPPPGPSHEASGAWRQLSGQRCAVAWQHDMVLS